MTITVPYTFVSGTTILSGEVNSNFTTIAANAANISGAETVSGTWTFSGSPVVSGTMSVTGTMQFDSDALRIADTNASHYLILTPGSDLTANRVLTLTTGDAARTITLSGNPTLSDWFDQSVKTSATPSFTALAVGTNPAASGAIRLPNNNAINARNAANSTQYNLLHADTSDRVHLGDSGQVTFLNGSSVQTAVHLVFTADSVIRRSTSDASDNGSITLQGGGANSDSRGGSIVVWGNEGGGPGYVEAFIGNVANALFKVNGGGGTNWFQITGADGSTLFTSSKAGAAWDFTATAAGAILLPRLTTAERDSIGTNGMIIYNETLNKVQVYEGGAWVSVI